MQDVGDLGPSRLKICLSGKGEQRDKRNRLKAVFFKMECLVSEKYTLQFGDWSLGGVSYQRQTGAVWPR